jgi:hypothetical protein
MRGEVLHPCGNIGAKLIFPIGRRLDAFTTEDFQLTRILNECCEVNFFLGFEVKVKRAFRDSSLAAMSSTKVSA